MGHYTKSVALVERSAAPPDVLREPQRSTAQADPTHNWPPSTASAGGFDATPRQCGSSSWGRMRTFRGLTEQDLESVGDVVRREDAPGDEQSDDRNAREPGAEHLLHGLEMGAGGQDVV